MYEAILVMSIYYVCTLMPLRGKDFTQLTAKQQQRVYKQYQAYMASGKGKKTPQMQIQEYLPILQKRALTFLILAIILAVLYIFLIIFIYGPMFA